MIKGKYYLWIALVWVVGSCTEWFDPTIDPPENVMAVEGLITNGPGPYSIKLFMTSAYGNTPGYQPVTDAQVMVQDQDNETTFFNENEPGIYLSPNGFTGITGHTYTLFINTSDGESYQSESQTIIPGIVVDSLEVAFEEVMRPIQDAFGGVTYEPVEGVKFYADIQNYEQQSPRMRFETQVHIQYLLEEKEPWPDPDDPDLMNCFRKVKLGNTVNVTIPLIDMAEDNTLRHELEFMPSQFRFYEGSEDWFLRYIERRAIILHQFTLNPDSYRFYYSLHEQMSAEGHIFDPIATQLQGNMNCVSNPDRIVLGHFEASSYQGKVFLLNPEPITENRLWLHRRPDLDYLLEIPDYSHCVMHLKPVGWIYY